MAQKSGTQSAVYFYSPKKEVTYDSSRNSVEIINIFFCFSLAQKGQRLQNRDFSRISFADLRV